MAMVPQVDFSETLEYYTHHSTVYNMFSLITFDWEVRRFYTVDSDDKKEWVKYIGHFINSHNKRSVCV